MSKKEDQYSLRNLQKLYTKLINQQPFSGPSSVSIPQTLNEMGKIIVWGERQRNGIQNGDIFDFICEVKLFDLLLEIFTKCKNVDTINAVIGFYNMLLTNITKPETVMYLLSHPCILSMQLTKFGTMANELAEYYINFLKGLSRKIDINTIHIFFNKRYPNFPLLFQTIRFFNHPENLVRTTCRNIILSVFRFSSMRHAPQKLLKIQQKQKTSEETNQSQILVKKLTSIHKYLTSFPFCVYYVHQSNFIKEYWKILDQILQPEGGEQFIYENQQYQIQNLDEIISDHEQLLIYLDDLLFDQYTKAEQNSKDLEQSISFDQFFLSAFANQCLSELVMSLCSIKKAFLGIKTTLLVFIFLLNNIRNQFLSQALVFILFSKYYPKPLTHKLLNPVQNLLSYNKEWKFKGFWDGHEDKINEFCSKNFYQDKSVKSDTSKLLNQSFDSNRKSNASYNAFSVFGTASNYYDRQVQKLEKIFGINILKKNQSGMQENYSSTQRQNRSFSAIFKEFLNELPKINAGSINLLNFDQNPVATNLFSFLESKDDTLVMLTLCLLEKTFSIRSLSKDLIAFCKLSIKPIFKDFSSIMTIQSIALNCLRIFIVDPPNFRICTYKQAAKVFLHFIKLYENEDIQLPKEIIIESKRALKTAISRITPYMYGGKQWEKVVEIYLIINRENNKFRKNNLRTYGLIPEELMNYGHSKTAKPKFTDELYESIPRNFDQQIGRDIWIYIILKEILTELSSNVIISKHLNLKMDVLPTKQNKVSRYEEGKSYNLQKDEHFKAFYKRVNEDKYKECDIILLGGYLVLGSEQYVEFKLPYEQTYLIVDKSDPRKLLVQSSLVAISIQFQNIKQTLLMKQNFTQTKNLLLKCHLSSLIKEIEGFQTQLK